MRPEINESQFALGANMEFESGRWRYPLISPALLPTRREEKHAGFDMEGEIKSSTGIEPLFVQYKCSEHMVGNARYHQHFPDNYYRFKIRKNKQHNILVKISEYHPHTYYVAPIFHTLEEYRDHHNQEAVLDNSVFATCEGLPGMDATDRHTIGFTQNRTIFFSEPTQIQFHIGFEQVLSEIAEDQSTFSEIEELQGTFTQLTSELSEEFELEPDIPDINEGNFQWLREMQYLFQSIGIDLIFLINGSVSMWERTLITYS